MDDYTPSPSDFNTDFSPAFPEDPTFLDPRPLPAPGEASSSSSHVYVDSFPLDNPRRKRRPERRTVIPNLPPLPAGEMPKDGDSRFDWRQTAPSQMIKDRGGKRWFPHLTMIRTSAAKSKLMDGDTFFDELTRYSNHFLPLLNAEHAEEQRLFNERLKDWSLTRLQQEGFAMTNLRGKRSKWPAKQGGTVWEFRKFSKAGTEMKVLPFHRFTSGRSVILSRTTPLQDAILENGSLGPPDAKMGYMQAQIYSSGAGFIRLQTDKELEDVSDGSWRLDVGLNPYVLNAQKDAIRALNNDPILQDVSDILRQRENTGDLESNTPEQTILEGTALRDKLLRAFQQDFIPYESTTSLSTSESSSAPNTRDADGSKVVNDGIVAPQHNLKADDVDAIPVPRVHKAMSGTLIRNKEIKSWAERHRVEGEVEKFESDPDVPLNPSQLRAIAMMISERLSLVQGPPGTGKTRVIIETIKLLKKHWKIPHPILVTAHTNVAVDNLVAGLRDHDVKAVRIGNIDRVRPDLQEFSFDVIAQSHPLAAEVEQLQADRESLFARDSRTGAYIHSPADRNNRSKEINKHLHRLRARMFSDVLLDADVICTTCLSAASLYILKHTDFPIVFLDEASMATEPLSLIPLMKGSSHVAIIGDHKQLPPVIISETARAGGLATSLFERLIHERHVPSIMLDTQYRMHPDISAFASKTFYNSDLKDGTVDSAGNVVPGFDIPESRFLRDINDIPTSMIFIDHDHPESPEMKSIANHGDAAIICDIVADILDANPNMSGSDIGIVAPYTAQIRAIDQKLKVDPYTSAALADVLGPVRALDVQNIEIKTVDGFEGREKQVIIFSATRCNQAGYIGFLADWRRLNVAITRAKRGLIIVGSAQTLENARISSAAEESLPAGGTRVWREFMAHLRDRGLIRVHRDLPSDEGADVELRSSFNNEEKEVSVEKNEEADLREVAEAIRA